MSVSLYRLTVESPLQMLDALCAVIDKASAHCQEKGEDPDHLLKECLADDMLPLSFQLFMAVHASRGVLEGIRAGIFTPPPSLPELGLAGFRELIADTASWLRNCEEDEVNGLMEKSLVFKAGEREIPFAADNFVLSFAVPNLYFHVTTAYAILRKHGVPLGKLDYLGALRAG